MRISDWSSDVCSSDLVRIGGIMHRQHDAGDDLDRQRNAGEDAEIPEVIEVTRHRIARADRVVDEPRKRQPLVDPAHDRVFRLILVCPGKAHLTTPPLRSYRTRSEEHTSELQSLMRISYAVFGLKKTTNT